MSFIGRLLSELPRSSAGSEDTARQVLSRCGNNYASALFIGDDCRTPELLQEVCNDVTAAFSEDFRAKEAQSRGLSARCVQLYELLRQEGGYDLVWYNGIVEFDGVAQRLERLREAVKKGGTVVYRTLCWLIDPSPDTLAYCTHRFGIIEPLDKVLRIAKEQGFSVEDFYIAPKKDWTEGYYKLLCALADKYNAQSSEDGEIIAGMGELKKETDMFALHCEEYSYVYYIMKG